jgi:hypothetical protein
MTLFFIRKTRYGLAGMVLALLLAPGLAPGLVPGLAAQQSAVHTDSLLLLGEDIRLSASPQGSGYELYVRKKTGVAAVQLFLYYEGVMLPLFTDEYYAGAGEGVFINSVAEPHDVFREAFYFLLPPTLLARTDPDGGLISVAVDDGFEFYIRAYAEGAAGRPPRFQDSPFTVRMVNLEGLASAPLAPNPLFNILGSRPAYRYSLSFSPGLSVFNPGPDGVIDQDFRLLTRFEPVGDIAFAQYLSGNLGYEIRFDRDPLLLNRLIVRGLLITRGFTLEAGPFFGLFNPDAHRLNAGLSTVFRANIPLANAGLSGHVRFDSSLGGGLSTNGDYRQDLQEAGLVCAAAKPFSFGVSLSNRAFSRITEEAVRIDSGWIRYNLSLRFAVPQVISIGLCLGYQELHWDYAASGPAGRTVNHRYWNYYAGLEGGFTFRPGLELTLYLELPVYPTDYFSDFSKPFLFNANLGLRWRFG